MESRGNIKDFAIICLPTKKDLKLYNKKKISNNHNPISEPLTFDKNEKIRKEMRRDHIKLLKRLRRRRVRDKRKKQDTSETRVRISKPMTEMIVSDQYKKMCNLWIPENPKTIKNQCSRLVIGYITDSGFTYTEAKSCGIGYIVAPALKPLMGISGKKTLLLLRNTNTRNYRFGEIKIRNT